MGLEQMLALHPTPIGRPRFFSQPAPYRFSIHIEPPRNRRDRLARLPQAPDLVPALLTDHPVLLKARRLEVDRLLNRHGPSCQADRRWGIFDDRAWGEEAAHLQTVQSRIERPFFDPQNVARHPLDRL